MATARYTMRHDTIENVHAHNYNDTESESQNNNIHRLYIEYSAVNYIQIDTENEQQHTLTYTHITRD